MPSQTRFPGAIDQYGNGTGWTERNDAKTNNLNGAICDLPSSGTSRYLRGSQLGFSLPSGAVVTDMEAAEQGQAQLSNIIQIAGFRIFLPNGDTREWGDNRYHGSTWSEFLRGNGLWGFDTVTWQDVNDPGFAVAAYFRRDAGFGTRWIECDYVKITVTYDDPPPASQVMII